MGSPDVDISGPRAPMSAGPALPRSGASISGDIGRWVGTSPVPGQQGIETNRRRADPQTRLVRIAPFKACPCRIPPTCRGGGHVCPARRTATRAPADPADRSAPGAAERAVGVRVHRTAELPEVVTPGLGHGPHRQRHEVRRVGPAAVRHRRQVRRVRLDQDPVLRGDPQGLAEGLGVLERDRAGEGQVRTAVEAAPARSPRRRRSSASPSGPAHPPRRRSAARRRARRGRGSPGSCRALSRARRASGRTAAARRGRLHRCGSSPARSRPRRARAGPPPGDDLRERPLHRALPRETRRLVGVQRDPGDHLLVRVRGLHGPARAREVAPDLHDPGDADVGGPAQRLAGLQPGSVGPSAMSRWQWLSTTGCGSGSGAGGRSRSRLRRRRVVPAAGRLVRHAPRGNRSAGVFWVFSCLVHRVVHLTLGDAGQAGDVEDGLLAGRPGRLGVRHAARPGWQGRRPAAPVRRPRRPA